MAKTGHKSKDPGSAGWFVQSNVSRRWVFSAILVWAASLIAAYQTEIGPYLDSRIARPLDFQVRSWLGKSPKISPSLRILTIDDKTFATMSSSDLTYLQYARLFKDLDQAGARAIIVDGMFSKPGGGPGEAAAAAAMIAEIKTPVSVGSFVTPAPIKFREPLPLSRSEYRLSLLTKSSVDPVTGDVPLELLPPLVERGKWYAYGPAKDVTDGFRHIGHFLYGGYGTVAPLIKLSGDTVVPHLGLFAAKERSIVDQKIIVDGKMVPVDMNGNVTVNFSDASTYYDKEHTTSLQWAMRKIEDHQLSDLVQPDDVVLILPLMYTGNTDFKQTPVGIIPGGFIIAAMVNSVLTGEWLKPLTHGEGLIVLGAIIGAAIGLKCGVLAFCVALVILVLGGLVTASYLFSFHGIVVPWLFPEFGFVFAALTVFAEKARIGERKAQKLKMALEGSVSPDDLKTLLRRPEAISFEARERVVSLMFIDVVGFSLLAENMLPRMAFDNLKRMLSGIGDTVHRYGGIIDKTLGDGLLCYFGYRFDQDSSSSDHAEKALRCAIAIQEENLKKNLEAAAAGDPVYPLRIGINTASCYLGDLGSQDRIDFTVVGNGVNFAKRLEGACDMHSVLIGATTYDLVKGIGLDSLSFTKRFIRIKHHSELVESYEFDPFRNEPDLRAAALEGFRKCANIERVDQRWPVHDPTKIQLTCDFGEGQLVNFAHGGFSIKLPQLLAKGTKLNIAIDAGGGALKRLLAKEGIEILQGEVRWGYADGGNFVHGVFLTNIEGEKSDFLVQYLCEFAFTRDVTQDGARGKGDKKAS